MVCIFVIYEFFVAVSIRMIPIGYNSMLDILFDFPLHCIAPTACRDRLIEYTRSE